VTFEKTRIACLYPLSKWNVALFKILKPWTYLLIPDDQITGSPTLDGLAAKFSTS
jgi:hypothetical protein